MATVINQLFLNAGQSRKTGCHGEEKRKREEKQFGKNMARKTSMFNVSEEIEVVYTECF